MYDSNVVLGGNLRKVFGNVRVAFRQLLENFRKSSETGRKSSQKLLKVGHFMRRKISSDAAERMPHLHLRRQQ